MNKKMYELLEYDKVLGLLGNCALSGNVRLRIEKMEPYLSEAEAAMRIDETTEARKIIEIYGNPPLSRMDMLDKSIAVLGKGSFLLPEQLEGIAQFLNTCKRLKNYLKKAESTGCSVALYGNSIYDLSNIEEEINNSIRGSVLDDKASTQLAAIRRKININGEQIKGKLDSLLRNNKAWFSEAFVSLRNGHYTLPVKKEFRNQIPGSVIDTSQSGSTYFIEPSAARKYREELNLLQIEEENEVRRILYALTALVEDNLQYININIEAMESLDFIFAKAKLSMSMRAVPPVISMERRIKICAGRHPLLKAENVVPLEFECSGSTRGIIITGPNTGGKTVALKTIGLLSLMAQSGLHVPAETGYFTMNNYVLCDIGDGQSISENLSTFSSHISNIIEILKAADEQSLVLLDELGSGTDPQEGMGLAIAILEELSDKKCLLVATTHYPELKEFAKSTPGLINARMAFDSKSLMPLYRLEIGEAGESCALYIARRLGLSEKIIDRAEKAAYGNNFTLKIPGNTLAKYPAAPTLGGCSTNNLKPVSKDCKTDLSQQKKVKPAQPKSKAEPDKTINFNIGDSVIVFPQKFIGIVYQKANDKGEVGVQVKRKKLMISHKRLKLHVSAKELYPDNYDFSIIFDTVENRKTRHEMTRKHNPDLAIEEDSNTRQ